MLRRLCIRMKRILDIMDEANESVKAVYDSMGEKLANERKLVSGDKLELKSLLQDLKDTDKYMGIIEERNKKIAKQKKWKEEDTESSPYAAVKPEIKINRDYFEQQGISFEEPEEKTEKAAPEISVNLDSEYFKWKEQEGKEEDSEDEKQPEKKGFFGKFMK